jgi:hypothetical protein
MDPGASLDREQRQRLSAPPMQCAARYSRRTHSSVNTRVLRASSVSRRAAVAPSPGALQPLYFQTRYLFVSCPATPKGSVHGRLNLSTDAVRGGA